MSSVQVYRYWVYSDEQGTHVPTEFEVYATIERINWMGEGKEIQEKPIIDCLAFLDVDESLLVNDGFYHPRSR